MILCPPSRFSRVELGHHPERRVSHMEDNPHPRLHPLHGTECSDDHCDHDRHATYRDADGSTVTPESMRMVARKVGWRFWDAPIVVPHDLAHTHDGVPRDVAMQVPRTRVVGHEPEHEPSARLRLIHRDGHICRQRHCVAENRITA
eukprot:1576302-Rhodomonas_salina.2